MLSVGKLTPGRASYYCEQLPGGQDEYYTRADTEDRATWLGAASTVLDLDSGAEVGPDQFRRLLDARHPETGEPLGIPRTTAHRLAGFDLCFSAPKSVSVAWALAPPELAARIERAHDRAVAQAIETFEAEVARARRGKRAGRLIETDGVIAAAFPHRSSRAGDPQIHTHVVVPNLTVDASGRWSALAGDRVYRWAKTLGYMYQAALRAELTQSLGVRWGPVRKGAAEIEEIPSRLVDAFSKRRAQIVAALDAVGATTGRAAEVAALATRTAKDKDHDLTTLRQLWRDEAVSLGIGADILWVHQPRTPGDRTSVLSAEMLAPDGLTGHTSSFDRRDILQALAAGHPEGATTNRVRAAADLFLTRPELVALGFDHPAGPRYTTRDLVQLETRLLDRAAGRTNDIVGIVQAEDLARVLSDRPNLSDEQTRMVTALTTGGAGIQIVVGRAGVGKTYALDAARAAWEASGHTVIGAALAARAAAELQAGAGIASTTVERLLTDLDRPGPLSGLAPRTVLVVDEAGMLGTRKLGRLLDHAHRANAKVVLTGDYRQLPEIEAGGAFAALARSVPTVELTDNRRQTQAWERHALAELRHGDVPAAIGAYRQAGRLSLTSTADAARQQMVTDWWGAHQGGDRAAMYALRRADVDDVNQRARQILERHGRLGPERLTAAGREFAAGDIVVCLRNDRRLGVRNGTISILSAVNPKIGEVELADGTRLPSSYLQAGNLAHGYCTTIHKAQGQTVDQAFLLGSEGLYREAGYVGLTRARHSTRLYIVSGPTRDGPGDDRDPVIETIRQLGQSRAQILATEQLSPSARSDGRAPPSVSYERTALLADPPLWLVDTLGPPPMSGPDRDRWAVTAERIAAYRDIHQINDPTDALGPRPELPEQRRAWDLAELAIHQHQRSLEIEQGLHL